MSFAAMHQSSVRNLEKENKINAIGKVYAQILSQQMHKVVNSILDDTRVVIYKNQKWQLFYILWWSKTENDKPVRRIVQISPVQWYHQLSQKDRFQIETDLNNGTNHSKMVPLKRLPMPVLDKIKETSHIDNKIKNMTWVFSYKNTKWKNIEVEILQWKIISATQNNIPVSIQQKAAIQKMILMGKFEKFHDLNLKAANEDIFEIHPNTEATQQEVQENIDFILDNWFQSESANIANPIEEQVIPNNAAMYSVWKWEITKVKKSKNIWKRTLDIKIQQHYTKIIKAQKLLQKLENTEFKSNLSGSNQINLTEEQFESVIQFIEDITILFGIPYSKKLIRNQELRKKLFKHLLNIIHPDKERFREVKSLKLQLFQWFEHIRDHLLRWEFLEEFFERLELRKSQQSHVDIQI